MIWFRSIKLKEKSDDCTKFKIDKAVGNKQTHTIYPNYSFGQTQCCLFILKPKIKWLRMKLSNKVRTDRQERAAQSGAPYVQLTH